MTWTIFKNKKKEKVAVFGARNRIIEFTKIIKSKIVKYKNHLYEHVSWINGIIMIYIEMVSLQF